MDGYDADSSLGQAPPVVRIGATHGSSSTDNSSEYFPAGGYGSSKFLQEIHNNVPDVQFSEPKSVWCKHENPNTRSKCTNSTCTFAHSYKELEPPSSHRLIKGESIPEIYEVQVQVYCI